MPSTQSVPRTFAEFYPYYLTQHSNRACRRLHFVGTSGVIALLFSSLVTLNPWLLLLAPVVGYGFAWVGHFFFEKNKPAAFKKPLWSLWGDFVMYRDILTGRIPF
ncbi:MAG: DUF962 domain-containing protein [Salinisphaeraceae bacterium]|nr:DUF962 domain-containing protein [Salinisphaeraceae bacterium]